MSSQITLSSIGSLSLALHTQAMRTGTQFLYFVKAKPTEERVPNAYVAWFVNPEVREHGLNSPMNPQDPASPDWNSTFRVYQFATEHFDPKGFDLNDYNFDGDLKLLPYQDAYVESSIGTSTRSYIEETLNKMGLFIPPDRHIYYKGNRLSLYDATVDIRGKDWQPHLVIETPQGEVLGVPLLQSDPEYVDNFERGVLKKFCIYIRTVSG